MGESSSYDNGSSGNYYNRNSSNNNNYNSGSGYNNSNNSRNYNNYNNYNDKYNNSNSNSGSGYGGSNYIPASRRSDGSYRSEIRVRPGYSPEAEQQPYVPPPARNLPLSSVEDLDNRVDSWADEVAPVVSDFSEVEDNKDVRSTMGTNGTMDNKESSCEGEPEIALEMQISESKTASTGEVVTESAHIPTTTTTATASEDSSENASATAPLTREPRKPSQLATAIDTALDSLTILETNSESPLSTSRPIGRFAAQIANDEREGRTYRPYNRDNRDGYSYGYNRESGGYNRENIGYNRESGGYNRDNYGYSRDYRSSSNWNRNSSDNNNNNVTSSSAANSTIPSSSSSEIRQEKEFKTFLDQLNTLRREMAVINAKLEYIKYFKGLGREEMSATERDRLAMEPVLISRMDSIFEAIDALQSK